MRSKQTLFAMISTGIVLLCFISFTTHTDNAENNSPKVNITTPLNNGKFQWNAMINYLINVSDKEDGASEYNEINATEVLLKVVYMPDSSKLKKYLSDKINTGEIEPPGLLLIKTSTCFTCHAAKSKLIGPPFELVAKRYSNNTKAIDTLAEKVINGSKGVWGTVPMPPHTGLKIQQAREMISWILTNNSNPDFTFFVGIQGAFRTKQKPIRNTGKGVYVLTASYADHGLNGLPQSSKRGVHTVVLKSIY
jgi:cytochrome c